MTYLNFILLVCIGTGYGGLVLLFPLCILFILFSSLSQLAMCHIFDVLYDSISSGGDSGIPWFAPCCIQLLLVYNVYLFVLLIR